MDVEPSWHGRWNGTSSAAVPPEIFRVLGIIRYSAAPARRDGLKIQIARAKGADVFATASGPKKHILAILGATAIDYQTVSVDEYVGQFTNGHGFDVICNTAGGSSLDDAMAAIKYYGHITSCSAFGTHNLATGSLRCATLSGVCVLSQC
ncbi:zinc-binding dehydrogenase [Pseudomonas sp. CVAP|uniref:zinc-binding dehydrogenase n=1 Tax=Pseudomonas sp. CVAP\|nr:zinc-binding dehydrogenase [Pseudomonas sp. CVAP\